MSGVLFLGSTWGSGSSGPPVPVIGGDFWYDASQGRYFNGNLATGATTTSWTRIIVVSRKKCV